MTTVADTRPLRHWLHGTDGAHLIICCVEHPDPGAWSRAIVGRGGPASEQAVIQLTGCIAQVTPAVLLELVAGGACGITVALDGCANTAGAQEVVTRAGDFLSALGRPEVIDWAFVLPRERKHGAAWPILGEGAMPVSRRALFGRRDGLDLVEPSEHPTERLVAVLGELADRGGLGTQLDGIPTGSRGSRRPGVRAAGSARASVRLTR